MKEGYRISMNCKIMFQIMKELITSLSACLSRPRLFSQFLSLILTLLFSITFAQLSYSADLTLAWDHNDQVSVTGYYVYYGLESGNYTAKEDAGSEPQYTIIGLDDLESYYIAVTAYNEFGESDFSEEIIYDSYACDADIDYDGDIDGSDLGLYAENSTVFSLDIFLAKFGLTDCP
jgi:hypothetical protein